MGTILALAAAVLYGSADFMGGVAARRARPLAVLAITAPAGAVIMVACALVAAAAGLGGHGVPGLGGAGGLAWGAGAGAVGAVGLLTFYAGFSVAPMSVVAPISALASALLPLAVALAQGERLSPQAAAGGAICLATVALVSMERKAAGRSAADRLRGLGYGLASGVMFGLFFLFFRSAGTSGVLGPVAVARLAGTVIALLACVAARVRPAWPGRPGGGALPIALASGTIDAAANVCYVLATRAGLFGIAVVVTALYPGMTVLLARFVLGERMRRVQRAGLILAAAGLILVTI